MTCPRCGAETPEGARFCPNCGNELASAGPREERKFVSILFVDQVGSTQLADGADPEDVRERNQLYYDEVRGRIELPIVGMGGVQSGPHADDLRQAGADLVAVGTESFRDPLAGARLADEMSRFTEGFPANGARGVGVASR